MNLLKFRHTRRVYHMDEFVAYQARVRFKNATRWLSYIFHMFLYAQTPSICCLWKNEVLDWDHLSRYKLHRIWYDMRMKVSVQRIYNWCLIGTTNLWNSQKLLESLISYMHLGLQIQECISSFFVNVTNLK